MSNEPITIQAPGWLLLSAAGLALLVGLLPLEWLVAAGAWVAPGTGMQPKTVLLLHWLRLVLPLLGLALLVWVVLPPAPRRRLHELAARSRPELVMGLILVLALVVRLFWIAFYPTQPYADSTWYYRLATWLAQGYGYVYDLETQRPTAAWPVGYPAFLGMLFVFTGPQLIVAQLANVALSVFIVYQTYVLGRRLDGTATALLAALLLAVLPGFIVYSSLLNADLLFMALTLAALNLTLLPLPAGSANLYGGLLVGLCTGAAALTRSTGLMLLPLLLLLHWLLRGHTHRRALLAWGVMLVIGTGAVVLPWATRNYVQFGRIIPISTNGGVNFWIGNNPHASGGFVFPRDAEQNPLQPLIGDEHAVDRTGYRLGLEFVRAQPDKALALLPAKVFYLYNSNDAGLAWNSLSALREDQTGAGRQAYAFVNLIYTLYAGCALLGLTTLLLSPRRRAPLFWVGIISTLWWTLVHLPFFGIDRFALPLLPFLAVYAAVGLLALARYESPRTGAA
jgi:4-amino-4-deoxy-L-arabinose transferase-like glycosyltransferase